MLNNREERRSFLAELKSKPCIDCGNLFPWYCMDFDHVPERGKKSFEVNQSTIVYKTLEEVMDELKKCDAVCSNCHRARTHNRNYPGARGVNFKDVCKYGHDLTDPKNQTLLNGKRKGCLECRRINVNAKYHDESHLSFEEKEERYHQRLLRENRGRAPKRR